LLQKGKILNKREDKYKRLKEEVKKKKVITSYLFIYLFL
jgi:hypothetical protein